MSTSMVMNEHASEETGAELSQIALLAAILKGDTLEKTQDLFLLDVAPLLLGIETTGSVITAFIKHNMTELCQDLFCSMLEPVEKIIRDSKIDNSNVHKIILIDGSTRIPQIVKFMPDFFNDKEPCKSINSDEAVVYSATIH
ncbi:heat shock cognate 70 [Sanghuangporus baumii]|uniref:Heat shock cognate 70 n=1 Tax=Sanghuangporus baumii TaxID=108892 RepID=A0A9Q5I2S7_SANBA|nr:heat shock cognate 70 [Sanghuangporus baumii]